MSDDLGPCGDPAQDEDEESAVAWRRLRDIFEEDGLTDHSAEGHIFESAHAAWRLRLEQMPRLAARCLGHAAPPEASEELGCRTEAGSATGATVWDSSVVVSRLLQASAGSGGPFDVRGRSVVELGTGCGLVSCVAWQLGASRVTATDRAEILPLLQRNLAANCASTDDVQRRCQPRVVTHMWGSGLEEIYQTIGGRSDDGVDLVFAVDCIYDQEAVRPLLTTLSGLCRGRGGGDEGAIALVAW
eukprot:CAMPEP_0203923696 /NCGR_PEP_ID=MMETSP0359-20131031/63543_1 /ASSEMBLY_ACC=CAM_ASM_000338 /TAXON_ID=268821 /ORGANISM="Scrippsiella Hangoei, Strain SHTV-5" /LENGTH=243 /DNA_ID=CAMNT_0050851803 /DNA_START=25 /DNA_END=753 /DNA_ORIENTATION=+